MEKGQYVQTPRFLEVKIEEVFESVKEAEKKGYVEGTDYRDPDWHVRGRFLGENRMCFAAVKRA